MSALLARWAVRAAVLAAIVACARDEREGPRMVELAPSLAPVVPEGPNSFGWRLQEAGESLRFLVGDLDREVSASPLAESVPLANGGVLAAVTDQQDWESLTCYLELQPCDQGWCPKAVGLYFASDFGLWWEEPDGRVLVDTERPDLVDCRVELVGKDPGGDRGSRHEFRRDFRIRTGADSVALRNRLSSWTTDKQSLLRLAR